MNAAFPATFGADENSSDEVLASLLVQHRPEALEQVHRRYIAVLWNAIMGVLGDETEASDVLQEVFIQIWKCAQDYSPEKGRLQGWLVTLARRRALDRLRQRRTYGHLMERLEMEYMREKKELDEEHTPERDACVAETSEILKQSIRKLPPAQAQVIALAFFQNLSQREIASGLGLPLGTVKSRIELGLRKLARLLGSHRQEVC